MHGGSPTIFSAKGMVSTAHPLASTAGVRILRAGGNAFDAAAAAAAALNVVEPFMSGLAGMGIAICYVAKERRVRVLNFMPDFPSRFDPEAIVARRDLRRGGYGVGLPGSLAGWATLIDAYGNLSLSDALEPAIRFAHDGFGLSELSVSVLHEARRQIKEFPELYTDWAEIYERPINGGFSLGTVLRQPKLAYTFEAIAERGIGYLYGGPMGRALTETVKEKGGCITEIDIAEIRPHWQEPIVSSYRGNTIYTTPAPSNGSQLLVSLKLFEQQTPAGVPANKIDEIDTMIRCLRVAARNRIEGSASGSVYECTETEYIRLLEKQIHTEQGCYGPTEYSEKTSHVDATRDHTTSFTIGDKEGNLVTVIESLGQFFGSGVMLKNHGVALNDLLHYGSLSWKPDIRKRPIDLPFAPAIVEIQGKGRLAYGTPGGFGIPQTQAQALISFNDHGMRLQEAIDAPRVRVLPGRTVLAESRLVTGCQIEALSRCGHNLEVEEDWSIKVGGMHGILQHKTTGFLEGAADKRRDGYVAIE